MADYPMVCGKKGGRAVILGQKVVGALSRGAVWLPGPASDTFVNHAAKYPEIEKRSLSERLNDPVITVFFNSGQNIPSMISITET